MDRWTLFVLLFLLIGCTTTAKDQTNLTPSPSALLGTWKMDLRPTPTSPEYFQSFVVSSINGKKISGTFYGAPLDNGMLNTEWGVIHFAFETQDQSGPYHHSGTLRMNEIEGLTRSTGRDFLSRWTATKIQ